MFKLLSDMSRTERLKISDMSRRLSSISQEVLLLEFLPKCFCPTLKQLGENSKLVLGHLGVSRTRNYMMTLDEQDARPGWLEAEARARTTRSRASTNKQQKTIRSTRKTST